MSLWVIRELWREAFERPMPPLKGLCLRCHVKPVQHRPAISSAPDLESLFLYSVVFCLRPCQCNLSHKVSVALSRARCYLPPTMCMCVLLSNFECIEHFIVLAQRLQPQPCVCGDLHVHTRAHTHKEQQTAQCNKYVRAAYRTEKEKYVRQGTRKRARNTQERVPAHESARTKTQQPHRKHTHTHTHTHTPFPTQQLPAYQSPGRQSLRKA